MATAAPATNAHYAEIKALLRSASERRKRRRFAVEGPVLVAEALNSDLDVCHVVGSPELIPTHAHAGVNVFVADDAKLASALSTKSPRSIAAVVTLPTEEPVGPGGSLAMVEMSDPGNAGTMIRTAEAAGMAGVFMVGDCVDQWNPKVIRASAGAVFRLPVVRLSADELFSLHRSPVLATVVEAGRNYLEADLANAVVCLGNEAHGLSAGFVSRCDSAVTIPLSGPTESLNVAAAAAIVTFAALEQRRAITLSER